MEAISLLIRDQITNGEYLEYRKQAICCGVSAIFIYWPNHFQFTF